MATLNYNPDVLSCLANLSNDEVFTPPTVVNQMLDMLPAELWSNPNTTFLDPVSKTGVFLREIAKRLMEGLKEQIPDVQERANHIFTKQLYGIAITELTSLLSRRSLYCSKVANGKYSVCTEFADEQGNLRYTPMKHVWENGRCRFCGASQEVYEKDREGLETHAYQFIHTVHPEKIFNMRFDVIIGNPPYQLSSNDEGIQATPLYHKFIQQAKRLSPRYLSMIIPARWYAGGMGMGDFRNEMLNDTHIRYLHDFPKSRDCFEGVDIAGGICYYLWDREYDGPCIVKGQIGDVVTSEKRCLNEFSIFVRDNIGIRIIHKIKEKKEGDLSNMVYSISPFGLPTSIRGIQEPFTDSVVLISSKGRSYLAKEMITNKDLIDKYKIGIGQLNPDRGGVNNASDGKMNVTTKIAIYNKGEVTTATYLILGAFEKGNRQRIMLLTFVQNLFVSWCR
jgi:site-specific DNA-methyltransferase (adenine-specific)